MQLKKLQRKYGGGPVEELHLLPSPSGLANGSEQRQLVAWGSISIRSRGSFKMASKKNGWEKKKVLPQRREDRRQPGNCLENH
jgi:hypothetical protein